MALAIEIEKLDDVDESLREHYVPHGEKYRLDGAPDTAVLEDTLRKERDARKAHEAKLKGYDGIDPEEYTRLKEEAEARDKKKMLDAGKVDELLEKQKAQLEEKSSKDIAALTAERDELSTLNRKLLLTDVLKAEALKNAAHETALGDIVSRADVWQLQDGKPVAVDGEGTPILKEGRHITMTEWLTDLQTSAPHLFKTSSGGGTPPGGGSGNGAATGKKWADLDSYTQSRYPSREAYERGERPVSNEA